METIHNHYQRYNWYLEFVEAFLHSPFGNFDEPARFLREEYTIINTFLWCSGEYSWSQIDDSLPLLSDEDRKTFFNDAVSFYRTQYPEYLI